MLNHVRARSLRGGFLALIAVVAVGCTQAPAPNTSAAPTAPPAPAATTGALASASGTRVAFPATIRVAAVIDLTGPAGFAGVRIQDGLLLGLDEINGSGALGNSRLSLDVIDAATSKQQAIDGMTRVANDADLLAVLGPDGGSITLAVAPIAQSHGIPQIAIESGAPGIVETGNFIFRITPPQATLVGGTADYLVKNKGVKKVALLYDDTNSTLADLGKTAFPREFHSRGATIVGSETYRTGQLDYSALITKLLGTKPDAFGLLSVGADNATLVGQLRQAGFEGQIFGQSSMGAGNLDAVASYADGTVWSVTFDPTAPHPSVQKFVKAWQARKPGDTPNVYTAESYDAIWLLAYAIQQAPAPTRDGVRQGLDSVTSKGFDGGVGTYSFSNRDARMAGTLVQYQNGKEVFVH